jgi:hypothetical protein
MNPGGWIKRREEKRPLLFYGQGRNSLTSLDHLGGMLFHHLLPMDKGYVDWKTESKRRKAAKNYSSDDR